ncbi:MAG: response regulator, partial [Myxococcota bacterium]
GLPPMDRWHALKRLTAEPTTHGIPVVTLGSDGGTPSGLQRVLTKLERTIAAGPLRTRAATPQTAIPRPTLSPSPAAPRTRQTPAGAPVQADQRPAQTAARILVVDDHEANRDVLARRLERQGYQVEVAVDGESALVAIAGGSFDLVLLDWMMPGMTGLEVLRRVRETRGPIALPIVMTTARSDAEAVVEALKAEANDFVVKPLNFEIVHARIRTQLGLREAHRSLEASERRYRVLLENTTDLIVEFRAESGEIRYVSPACRTLLGYEPAELARRPFWEWVHPLDRRALEARRRSGELPPAFTFLARMMGRDGRWIWVETSCRLRPRGPGCDDPTVHAACRDVTEHVERLDGDEPPLPLGGDIMAHPGWRGGPTGAPRSTGSVVVTVLVNEPDLDPDAVSRRVADELRRVFGEERRE